MKIKNWDKFQHFKDRRPPWIKLYRDILDDPDWHELDGDTAKTLISLWLIASEDKNMHGTLPDIRRLSFRLRITENVLKQRLTKLNNWLIQDDIIMISDQYQVDAPETETETETEKEGEKEGEKEKEVKISKKNKKTSDIDFLKNYDLPENLANDFLMLRKAKKAPMTETALKGLIKEAGKAGISLEEAITICIERNWQSFKSDWINGNKNERTKDTKKSRHASIIDAIYSAEY